MTKEEIKALPPVSLSVFRQMVYDCGAKMIGDFDKTEIIHQLMTLADCPIKAPTVKVIIEDGVPQEVLADAPVDLEVVDIDKDYEDYDQLKNYRNRLYEDKNLKSCDFKVANFEE